MEKKFNDSSSALSRFGRDKRVRTVTAATERVERRPRTEFKAQDGSYRRDDKGARPAKRASYNPHFSEDNRPLFEQKEERRNSKFSAAGRGRTNRNERSWGEKRQENEKPFEKKFDKKFDKKGGDKPFDKKFDKKPFGDKKRSFKRDDERPRSYPKFNPERQSGDIRLNRFLAQSGICSRREADDFITAGLVSVNGVIVTELGTKVKPTDEVKFNDERIQGEKKVYLVLNKPKGYVTSLEDPHAEKVVMDLVKNACTERIYPVGRLDKNSLGLLLFTNDGDLTKTLTHPSYRKKKIYQVSLDKPLTRADMDRLAEGITLEDGEIFADEISYLKDNKQEVGIEIHSGRNRIVRRMFEFLGYTVTKLDRVYYAGLTKKNLKRGSWRFLTKEEVQRLKAGLYE
ncbi:MAG: rRNA pseudouridine synthase [Alistipes sp.]|nr:rRNA pseudouridine synthase [Alistipes sp.]